MRKVKTHCFNGLKYKIMVGEFDGLADTRRNARTLVVNCDLNTKKGLITLIHEAMHCGNWDKHEETIDRASTEIGSLIWREGFRIK